MICKSFTFQEPSSVVGVGRVGRMVLTVNLSSPKIPFSLSSSRNYVVSKEGPRTFVVMPCFIYCIQDVSVHIYHHPHLPVLDSLNTSRTNLFKGYWDLIMVLISICLIMLLSIFSCDYLSSIYLLC